MPSSDKNGSLSILPGVREFPAVTVASDLNGIVIFQPVYESGDTVQAISGQE
jgi:hypothetical protein